MQIFNFYHILNVYGIDVKTCTSPSADLVLREVESLVRWRYRVSVHVDVDGIDSATANSE